jgi:hypothetical protein
LTPEGITPSSDVGRGRIGGGAPRIWNAMIHRYTLVRERRLRAILPNIIEHRWRSRPPNRWATYVHTICYKRQAGGERCTRVPVVQLRSRPPCPSCWEWWILSSHKARGGRHNRSGGLARTMVCWHDEEENGERNSTQPGVCVTRPSCLSSGFGSGLLSTKPPTHHSKQQGNPPTPHPTPHKPASQPANYLNLSMDRHCSRRSSYL